jgi:hypothetical protein
MTIATLLITGDPLPTMINALVKNRIKELRITENRILNES